jgi:hypothetical protein
LSQTRCGKNSKRICPRGHPQDAAPPQHHAVIAEIDGAAIPSDWAWAEWVEQQGIGE